MGVFAVVEEAEMKETEERWANTLVVYVLGSKPYFQHFKTFAARMWRPQSSMEVFSRENGFFFCKFGTGFDVDRILEGGPWLYDGRLVVVRRWTRDLGFQRDLLASIPVWIRFSCFHLHLWSQKIISKVASLVGRPLFMDKATAVGGRLAFARCCVELSADRDPPRTVSILLPDDRPVEIPVDYEWIPVRCMKCYSFGHASVACPTTKVWAEKEGGGVQGGEVPGDGKVGDTVCSGGERLAVRVGVAPDDSVTEVLGDVEGIGDEVGVGEVGKVKERELEKEGPGQSSVAQDFEEEELERDGGEHSTSPQLTWDNNQGFQKREEKLPEISVPLVGVGDRKGTEGTTMEGEVIERGERS